MRIFNRAGEIGPFIGGDSKQFKILAEYDLKGKLVWMSSELGDILGVVPYVAKGYPLQAILPPPYNKQFSAYLKKLLGSSSMLEHAKFDLPTQTTGKMVTCYHLPVFDDNSRLSAIKIVGLINP